jgi:Secretion system C-terminal sorting domain
MFKFTTAFAVFILLLTKTVAQTPDTISIGAGYAQQVWYKIETDKETKAPLSNWDLAFSTRQNRDAAIWVNPNATLYRAVAPISAWASMQVDTNAFTPDKQQFNADTAWYTGAFNYTGDNLFNYGWGTYNLISHNVVGDSVYILKTLTGTWKKIYIEKLAFDTSYFVKYADLNGQNEKTFELKKKNFAGKYFGYYSFATDAIVDRDPLSKDWDLVAWRYIGLTPDQTGKLQNYPLTGIMSSDEARVAKVKGEYDRVDVGKLDFKTQINVIGADWKSFNQQTNKWSVTDSTAYFVKASSGKIYRLVFTGFGGSTTGNMIFTRQILTTSSVKDPLNGIASLAVYPNPVSDGIITLVYDLGKNLNATQNIDIQLFNLAGQNVFSQKTENREGVQQVTLPQLDLKAGIYFARINWEGKSLMQKIVVL